MSPNQLLCYFFFFNDTATTEIYTLSLHDALPISPVTRLYRLDGHNSRATTLRAQLRAPASCVEAAGRESPCPTEARTSSSRRDRKSTRLNSSHLVISYAVFCLKKKTGLLQPARQR